mmetsp:Transcript_23537/g.27790  ORF Transcript_23537/g.27790 Transcript_23537/m.27790 type:complete len:284 (+) Transcript_23537:58-909(+)
MIIYTVVARASDGSVLAECSAAGMEGNYPSVLQQLIVILNKRPKLISVGNRKTFMYPSNERSSEDVNCDPFGSLWNGIDGILGITGDSGEGSSNSLDHFFHVIRGEGVWYMCLSDDNEGRQQNVNFGFLNDVMKDFTAKYSPSKINRANAYAFEKSFSITISNLMHYYQINRDDLQKDESMAKLHTEVDSLKSVMGDNIDFMLTRHDALDLMVKKSESLIEDSRIFAKRSKTLKKTMRVRYYYYKIITAGVAILILYLIFGSVCGFGFSCLGDADADADADGD